MTKITDYIIYWKVKYINYSEQSKLELSGLVGSEVTRSMDKYGVSDTCRLIKRSGEKSTKNYTQQMC